MEQTLKPRFQFRNLLLFVPALVLFLGLTGYNFWRARQAALPVISEEGVPVSAAIEEKFGVRFTGVHVLARNGLVDLRYRVIDVGKARNFGHYTETSPMLIAQDGKTIEVTIMGMHNHRVEAGRAYYILYRNTADALDPGDKVTIKIGDLSLTDVIVQ